MTQSWKKMLILIFLVVVEEDWKTTIMEYGYLSAYKEVVFLKVKCKLNSVKVRTEYMVDSIHTGCFRRNLLYLKRMFLGLIDIDRIKHIYSQSCRVMEIMMWSYCSSTHCTCLTWCIICTMHRSIFERIAKPWYTEARVLSKQTGNLRTIFMKLVWVFLA